MLKQQLLCCFNNLIWVPWFPLKEDQGWLFAHSFAPATLPRLFFRWLARWTWASPFGRPLRPRVKSLRAANDRGVKAPGGFAKVFWGTGQGSLNPYFRLELLLAQIASAIDGWAMETGADLKGNKKSYPPATMESEGRVSLSSPGSTQRFPALDMPRGA